MRGRATTAICAILLAASVEAHAASKRYFTFDEVAEDIRKYRGKTLSFTMVFAGEHDDYISWRVKESYPPEKNYYLHTVMGIKMNMSRADGLQQMRMLQAGQFLHQLCRVVVINQIHRRYRFGLGITQTLLA